jgi:nitrogen fixation/metabolism regulation signal transduction histidine kinase
LLFPFVSGRNRRQPLFGFEDHSRNKNQTFLLFWENSGWQIEPEIVSKIFEPFFTSKPKVTGLGLAIKSKISAICLAKTS